MTQPTPRARLLTLMARHIAQLRTGDHRLDDAAAVFFAMALRMLHVFDTEDAGGGRSADAVRSEHDLRAALRDMTRTLLTAGIARTAVIDALAHELAMQQTLEADSADNDEAAPPAQAASEAEEDFVVKASATSLPRYARVSAPNATAALALAAHHFDTWRGELEVWTLVDYQARYGPPGPLERI